MLNWLIPYALRLRHHFPETFDWLVAFAKRYLGRQLGVYPRPLANELKAVGTVLASSRWNMTAGRGLVHETLEQEFAQFIGVPYAIAVNTGGMALQMSMRALGLKPGDEVSHQVDTCSATALAVIAAGCTPMFVDISERTFMMDKTSLSNAIGSATRAIIATHMWGNPEDMTEVETVANRTSVPLIEDACLALGTRVGTRMAGALGKVGVFSFGCLKPIQAGEGGMIVTADEALARELRAMRHWGDRTIEFGVRDTIQPAWNGRMSEIVAAVALEQLRGYPIHLSVLREAVAEFNDFINRIDGVQLVTGNATSLMECAFTQVVLRLNESRLGRSKTELKDELYAQGVPVWHANFEPIPSLSLFQGSAWQTWLPKADLIRTGDNYRTQYPVSEKVMSSCGLGLGKMNFLSRSNVRHLIRKLDRACTVQ